MNNFLIIVTLKVIIICISCPSASSPSRHQQISNTTDPKPPVYHAVLYLQPTYKMKLVIATVAIMFGSATAFAPSITRAVVSQGQSTVMFAEPKEKEGGLDLDLEEMFDM
jgi:hypothetical protein